MGESGKGVSLVVKPPVVLISPLCVCIAPSSPSNCLLLPSCAPGSVARVSQSVAIRLIILYRLFCNKG